MKNLLIGIFALFITVSCNPNQNQTADTDASSERTDSLAPQLLTLNGIPFADADKMVKDFQQDQKSSHQKTNIWFSKEYVSKIYSILDAADCDGIRIYFARKADGDNTIVIVSTRDNGESNSPPKKRHKDYFEHYAPFLSTNEARSKEDYGTNPGARLYEPALACPPQTCRSSENRVTCRDAHTWVKQFRAAAAAEFKTKGVWFSKELLGDLRDELNAVPNKKGDGIRIYFVLKPSGKHNLVIVTTKDGGKDYLECYNKNFMGADDNGEECPNFCQELGDATWS